MSDSAEYKIPEKTRIRDDGIFIITRFLYNELSQFPYFA